MFSRVRVVTRSVMFRAWGNGNPVIRRVSAVALFAAGSDAAKDNPVIRRVSAVNLFITGTGASNDNPVIRRVIVDCLCTTF